MRKKIIGIIVIGTSLLLASCGSRGEVKRSADGKQVLSGYITLSGAFALYPLAIQWADEFPSPSPRSGYRYLGWWSRKGYYRCSCRPGRYCDGEPRTEAAGEGERCPGVCCGKGCGSGNHQRQQSGISGIVEDGIEPEAGYGDLGRKDEDECLHPKRCLWVPQRPGLAFLGKKQEDLKGTGVFGGPGVAETLQKDVNGIGFNNIGYAYNDKNA